MLTLSVERERELIALTCSGTGGARDAAFAELVRMIGPPLLALCISVTGSRADAEDALQDTLCTVAKGLSRFRGEARLYTWCHRIAIRAAIRVKARNRAGVADPTVPGATTDPHDERDAARHVLAGMAHLTVEQRAVFTLFVGGHSQQQIAEILGVPTGTVWSRLHASRKRLREVLQLPLAT